jgi:hypothetical protein
MCHQLLELYGRREHARLKLPLSVEDLFGLLDIHHRQRFVERHASVSAHKFAMDQNFSGRNWQTLERDSSNRAFRWSGPGRCATLDLPLAAASDLRLRFLVPMAIKETLLETMQVKMNDEPIQMSRRRLQDGTTLCEGYVTQASLRRFPGCARLSLELETTIRPREIIEGSRDDRLLGIALSWVEVEPVGKNGT